MFPLSLIPLCAHKTDIILQRLCLGPSIDAGWSRHPPRSPNRHRCDAQEVSIWQVYSYLAREGGVWFCEERRLSTHHRTIAVMQAGMKLAGVATHNYVSVRDTKMWLYRDHMTGILRSRAGLGKVTVTSLVAKIILVKTTVKRRQSIGKLARKLIINGHLASKTTMHQYQQRARI